MAHPAGLFGRQSAEQDSTVADDDEVGAAELAGFGSFDVAAERLGHRLHAVTDAEDRNPEFGQFDREVRGFGLMYGCRPAGEDERLGVALAYLFGGSARRKEFGEDAALPDPASDQLGVLAPEIEDQHFLGCCDRHQSSATSTPADTAARPLEPMPTDCSCWSFLPSVISAGAIIISARWNERMSS